ncbi:hypothetical protein PANT111_210022 [Pantoea brenneri]|uniref:Transposase n=1 Tax=Pantoea brenneri TaxID=472694 RepID=A0AAX3J8J9_9GAMM|nr:hypothetical protein PANT111_210022 [Pantoea brenneri]
MLIDAVETLGGSWCQGVPETWQEYRRITF